MCCDQVVTILRCEYAESFCRIQSDWKMWLLVFNSEVFGTFSHKWLMAGNVVVTGYADKWNPYTIACL